MIARWLLYREGRLVAWSITHRGIIRKRDKWAGHHGGVLRVVRR